jgi:hypothetical protein
MNSTQLLPAIRDLYWPSPGDLSPGSLGTSAHPLLSLGYVDDLAGEAEIAAVVEMADGLPAMEGCLMEGGSTARPLDYFALLVGASVVALVSAVVATLCVKFEQRGLAWFWAACFFGSALVAAYCLGRLV